MSSHLRSLADFDRLASSWLADGPTELSDRVLADTLREVHLTPQRRRWALRRNLAMTFHPSAVFARVATVVLGAGALTAALFLLGPGQTVGPAASPTAPSSASGDEAFISLGGRIVDAAGAPLAATVSATRDTTNIAAARSTSTDPSGAWSISSLPGGGRGYYIRATIQRASGTTWQVDIYPPGRSWGAFTASATGLITTVPLGTQISGVILDADGTRSGSSAVARLSVQAVEMDASVTATAPTRPDGSFTIDVPRGAVKIRVIGLDPQGGRMGEVRELTVSSTPVNGFSLRIVDGSAPAWPSQAPGYGWTTFSGRITDASGSGPRASITASVRRGEGDAASDMPFKTVVPDATGHWTMRFLGQDACYHFSALVAMPVGTWTVPVGSSAACYRSGSSGIDLTLPPFVTVSGSVVDQAGTPIIAAGASKVNVNAFQPSAPVDGWYVDAQRGEDSTFSLALPPGAWRVVATITNGVAGTWGPTIDLTVGTQPITGLRIVGSVPAWQGPYSP